MGADDNGSASGEEARRRAAVLDVGGPSLVFWRGGEASAGGSSEEPDRICDPGPPSLVAGPSCGADRERTAPAAGSDRGEGPR
jgi:hypothetical protein